MQAYKKLLLANRGWAAEKEALRPGYFGALAEGQQPTFLWIGCSDSRVPAEEITGAQPGEVFTHRNIANLYLPDDLNANCVLEYAVKVLKVKHVIVCGHYGCGGVNAALSKQSFGLLDKWLANIKSTQNKHQEKLGGLSPEAVFERMVELSVEDQVRKLTEALATKESLKNEQRPMLHGWVFGLKDGLLREIVKI